MPTYKAFPLRTMSTKACRVSSCSVEGAVGDGFHDVVLQDAVAGLEVGDGAGHLEDAVVGACTHVHAFHGLAHHLEHRARKLRQLVEEEHSVVSQADFPGRGIGAASHQGNGTSIRLCGGINCVFIVENQF